MADGRCTTSSYFGKDERIMSGRNFEKIKEKIIKGDSFQPFLDGKKY